MDGEERFPTIPTSNLNAFKGYLEGVLGRGSFEAQSRKILEQDKDKRVVSRLFKAVCSDSRWLGETSRRSYRHNNGFDRIVLAVGPNKSYELRLHIWWEDDSRLSEGPHNHAWEFSSLILAGKLITTDYEVIPGDDYFHYKFLLDPKGGLDARVDYEGKKGLRVAKRKERKEGDIYFQRAPITHDVTGAEGLTTSTLVLKGPLTSFQSDIFELERIQGSKLPNTPFTPQEVKNKLERLEALLKFS